MASPDRTPEAGSREGNLFGSIFLAVPSLKARITKNHQTGQVEFDINLDHPYVGKALDELDTELNHKRLKGFRDGVLNGHKKAWYSAFFGGISIVVTTAIGVEFGPRHGKDIKYLLDLLEEHKKGKQPKSQ